MKQKLVEQTILYLRPLPKEERIIAVMDIALNVLNNIGLSPIEIAGLVHCIQLELDRDFKTTKNGIDIVFGGNEN